MHLVKPPLGTGKLFLACLADFYMCITDHCNDAEVTTAMLLISVKYHCGFFTLFEKIYHDQPILTDFSNIGEDVR
jgi:hypothetical protein